jgi:hypothetical protein
MSMLGYTSKIVLLQGHLVKFGTIQRKTFKLRMVLVLIVYCTYTISKNPTTHAFVCLFSRPTCRSAKVCYGAVLEILMMDGCHTQYGNTQNRHSKISLSLHFSKVQQHQKNAIKTRDFAIGSWNLYKKKKISTQKSAGSLKPHSRNHARIVSLYTHTHQRKILPFLQTPHSP